MSGCAAATRTEAAVLTSPPNLDFFLGGAEAAREGVSATANPYPKTSTPAKAWALGWLAQTEGWTDEAHAP